MRIWFSPGRNPSISPGSLGTPDAADGCGTIFDEAKALDSTSGWKELSNFSCALGVPALACDL
jgi:hypothetical protein